jgi:hypothetical protein
MREIPAAEPPHGILSFIKPLFISMFFLSCRLESRAAFTGAKGVTSFVGLFRRGVPEMILSAPRLPLCRHNHSKLDEKYFPAAYDVFSTLSTLHSRFPIPDYSTSSIISRLLSVLLVFL